MDSAEQALPAQARPVSQSGPLRKKVALATVKQLPPVFHQCCPSRPHKHEPGGCCSATAFILHPVEPCEVDVSVFVFNLRQRITAPISLKASAFRRPPWSTCLHWTQLIAPHAVSVSSTIDGDPLLVRSIPQACTPLKVCGVECICMPCDVLDKAEQVIRLVYNAY